MSGKTTRDDMYATRVAAPGDFVFDETVAAVFPDSESVNEALRALLPIISRQRRSPRKK